MNKFAGYLGLSVVLATGVAQAFVYETVSEFQAEGDFDGNGTRDLVIVDKITGDYRVAYQLAPGSFTWASARASGISGASGVNLGRLNSLVYDSLAITGFDANRVNILDANSPSVPGLPASVYLPSLGPDAVGVIEIGGGGNTTHADLYVASLYNGLSPYRETLLRNNGTTNRTVIVDNPLLYRRERLNPVLIHTNRPARLALMERNADVNFDLLRILDASSGAALTAASVATSLTPQPWEYVGSQFVRTNPYTQFLVYPPGGWYFYEYQITEPSTGSYSLVYTNQFVLTNYIDRLLVLPGTNASRLLVFDTNGVSAVVYSFNGLAAPTVLQQLNADPGEHFTGAGVFGNGGFMAYSAPMGQATSAKFKQWNWTGSGYSNAAAGDLPRINAYSASGNVMQFRYEPFVTNSPILLRINNAGDWSSRPQFSGSPGNISVRTESFLSSTQGLVNPTANALGAAHPLAAFGLANQYSNMISLFSFTPPAGDKVSDVTISPQPGIYPTAIQLQFSAANSTDTIYFRVGSGAWTLWNSALLVRLFTNAIVQYYGQPSGNAAKSSIRSAAYAFTQGAGTIDSDNDGVPDYVEVARGLDPLGGRDGDGDGYSDLEELIRGTDPLVKASAPTNYPHLDEQAAFDIAVTPLPWDGFSNRVSLSATGTVIRAFDFQGSLLSMGRTTNNPHPFARVTNISIVVEDRLVVQATESHYHILTTNADTKVGRELLGLSALPPLVLPSVPYVYGSGSLATEANNWINSASNTFKSVPRGLVTNSLTVNGTLTALLFELKTAQLLGARGSNWWTNLTLFPFRVSDVGRTNPTQATLLSLEYNTTNQPGYKLQTMFAAVSNLVENSANAGIASLRQLARDIYRIDSLLNNTNPATFVLPVDEIRYFLWNGTLDSNYLFWATSTAQFPSAVGGASTILASVSPRPTTNVFLVVRNDTVGGPCRLLDLNGGGTTVALINSSGLPFSFPDNFRILPGSLVEVSGYADAVSAGCAYPAIEVVSALLCAVPISTDADADGNLLIDTWEDKFYGGTGLTSPFSDTDGDGYSDLQEMIEGSDPRDFFGRPAVPVAAFAAPVLGFAEAGGTVELHFLWPAAYIGKFNFGVRHTGALGLPFTDLLATGPVPVSGNEFKMTFAAPATSQHFYYLTVALH